MAKNSEDGDGFQEASTHLNSPSSQLQEFLHFPELAEPFTHWP